jgi:hypothetical protein
LGNGLTRGPVALFDRMRARKNLHFP